VIETTNATLAAVSHLYAELIRSVAESPLHLWSRRVASLSNPKRRHCRPARRFDYQTV
jgi:hypothetical protein